MVLNHKHNGWQGAAGEDDLAAARNRPCRKQRPALRAGLFNATEERAFSR